MLNLHWKSHRICIYLCIFAANICKPVSGIIFALLHVFVILKYLLVDTVLP